MEVKINIKDEEIIDCLITALEGGSNYWYSIPDLSMIVKTKGKALSENVIISALKYDAEIPVFDIETDEELGIISKENIQAGLQSFINNGYTFDVAMDADEADVLFQFIVMGEIVYG